jgi:hypothetical protein
MRLAGQAGWKAAALLAAGMPCRDARQIIWANAGYWHPTRTINASLPIRKALDFIDYFLFCRHTARPLNKMIPVRIDVSIVCCNGSGK